MPLIDEETKKIMIQKKRFSLISNNKNHFFYPADGAGHKNHLRLLEAFLLINENYKLYLTLSENDFSKLSEKFPSLKTKSSKIINLGQMPRKKILKFYNEKVGTLIFPSLDESFGIPLIEATIYKKNYHDYKHSRNTIHQPIQCSVYPPIKIKFTICIKIVVNTQQ